MPFCQCRARAGGRRRGRGRTTPGRRSSSQAAAIAPSSASNALRVAARVGREGEDRLGVDGHARLGAGAGVGGEQLVVVQDPAVVDADDGPVPDRVVVGLDRRVALREVADVHEELVRPLGHGDVLEEPRGRASAA